MSQVEKQLKMWQSDSTTKQLRIYSCFCKTISVAHILVHKYTPDDWFKETILLQSTNGLIQFSPADIYETGDAWQILCLCGWVDIFPIFETGNVCWSCPKMYPPPTPLHPGHFTVIISITVDSNKQPTWFQ